MNDPVTITLKTGADLARRLRPRLSAAKQAFGDNMRLSFSSDRKRIALSITPLLSNSLYFIRKKRKNPFIL